MVHVVTLSTVFKPSILNFAQTWGSQFVYQLPPEFAGNQYEIEKML